MKTIAKHKVRILIALVLLITVFGTGSKALAAAAAQCGPFTDVQDTSIWCTYILRIYYLGITSGYADGTYRPNGNVTRGEMAAFLSRITTANTNDNEPYIYSVDNQDNGFTLSGDGIVAKSYDQNGIEGITYGAGWADYGVYGQSNGTGTGDYAVYGYSSANSPAVGGYTSADLATAYAIYGIAAHSHAVYGDSNSTSGTHYGGYFTGPQGVYANAELGNHDGVTARCQAGGNCWGVDTYSDASYGIYASTGNASNNYGLYTPDNVAALGYAAKAGFSMFAVNGGSEPLEVGDAVAVVGMGDPLPDSNVPVMVVMKANAENAAAVVGILTSAYQIEWVDREEYNYVETTFEDPEGKGNPSTTHYIPEVTIKQVVIQTAIEGPVAPGGYMAIQVQGIAQMKVDAGASIQAGDLLTLNADGAAVRAETSVLAADGSMGYQAGTIIGKALEPWQEGMTMIWVMVDLR